MSSIAEALDWRGGGRSGRAAAPRRPRLRSALGDRRSPRHPDPRRRDRRDQRRRRRRGRCRGARRSTPPDCTLFPAFFDPHVHLRTPGQEHKEDIETGTRSAAAGGYCGIVAMANTDPVVDDPSHVRALRERATAEASVPTGFVATVTRGLRGEELTEMAALREAGAVGFSDDGLPIADAGVMRRALQYQHLVGGTILLHEEDPDLSAGGVDERGGGLRGARPRRRTGGLGVDDDRPRRALCLYEDGRAHVQHLSARLSVEAVEAAKAAGAKLTAELTPHHLMLTDEVGPPPRLALQDEPAAADRGRSPGADRRAAQRRRRLHRHRPRAARDRGEGGALRAGRIGRHRARDRLRGALHRAGRARRPRARDRSSSG